MKRCAVFIRTEGDLLRHLEKEFETIYDDGDSVLIKLHMGEPGNRTRLRAEFVAKIVDALRERGCRPFLFDSPVVYKSPRNNEKEYLEVAARHGFSEDSLGVPVRISDRFEKVRGETMDFEILADPLEADGVLLLTHFKGHMCSGTGGSIKNVGMGCMSKRTKGAIHDGGKPVYGEGCSECGACAENCPTGNIRIADGGPEFDVTWCCGCSICAVSCPVECITPDVALFDRLLAEGAALAFGRYGKPYAVNVLRNMTKLCDCVSDAGPVITDDLGFVCGSNMVDVDIASLDVIRRETGRDDPIGKANGKDSRIHMEEAAEVLGLTGDVVVEEI